jgi:succinate dehydrogenase/fumarate reductase iron-sulfur protein
MKLKICDKEYLIDDNRIKRDSLLSILNYIKAKLDNTLSFRSGCRSGVCGSCAVRVNGVERLACKTHLNDGDVIEPLKNSAVIKDLVVDISNQESCIKNSFAYLKQKSEEVITPLDEKSIDLQSNCILCNSCYSSCPVYEVNKEFLGPFALTRVYRYVNDKKEAEISSKIDTVQSNGVWDCTLCGNCNMVCPQHIDIKNDIMMLRNKSAQQGYSDPSFSSSGFSGDTGFDTGTDFLGNQDFGFNPNQF